MQLVIVESPAKAKTIEKYLGKDFKVLASYGHVRDLPPKDGSVRPDEGFEMDWELYRDKQSRFKEIADNAKKADRLILAPRESPVRLGPGGAADQPLQERAVFRDVARVGPNVAELEDRVEEALV